MSSKNKSKAGSKDTKIFDPSGAWLGKVSRKGEIISRLSELHEVLRDMPQLEMADRPAGFKKTVSQLISARILGNSDKDMRLLACCCLCDIFRISAPDIPFSDEECVKVFEVLVNQLRGLATFDRKVSGTGTKIMYILRSLATVNTCVLPVILAAQGVEGAEEVVTGMFHAFISGIHSEHEEEVSQLMIQCMLACLEECDEIPQELLDVILQPLLPSFKTENQTAYAMVGRVLQSAPANTQVGVSTFLNQVLVGAQPGTQNRVAESELTDHIYPLIYEIHRLAPDLLLKVLPNVCTQLQAEENDVRLKACKLLGRLFASTFAEYGTEFNRNFREFVGRFVDVSSPVRLEMIDNAALIMKRKPSLRDQIEKQLRDRLRDSDAEVRQGALQRLVELAQEDPQILSVATFEEMGLRVKDKKPEIRKGALVGLSKIYSKHISASLPSLQELTDAGENLLSRTKGNLVERLSGIPALVINSWSYPDNQSKYQVLQLLQEYILPRLPKGITDSNVAGNVSQSQSQVKRSTQELEVECEGRRASALYFLYSTLNEKECGLLSNLMQYKNFVRKELLAFLAARNAVQAPGRGGATPAQTAVMKNSLMRLVQALPVGNNEKKALVMERLPTMKDRNIYKLLARAAQPLDASSEAFRGRDDVRARCETKSPLGEYVGRVCDVAGYFVANEDIVDTLVNHAAGLKGDNSVVVAKLLAILAKFGPKSFSASAESMQSWLSALLGKGGASSTSIASAPAAPAMFAVVLRGADGLSQDDRCIDLVKLLLKVATENPDADVCEKAAEAAALLALYSEAEDVATSETGKVMGRLSDTGVNACGTAVLSSMRQMTSKSRMTTNNSRLVGDLHAITAIVTCPVPAQTIPNLKRAYCARIEGCGPARRATSEFIRDHLLQSGNIASDQALAVAASLSTWTAVLCSEIEVHESGNRSHSDSDSQPELVDGSNTSPFIGGPENMQDLAECLWGCVAANGATIGNRSVSSPTFRASLHESAISAAFEIVRRPSLGKFVSVQAWKDLAWALNNIESGAQERLAHQLFSMVQTSGVHLKFLVYPALFTTDDHLGYEATQSLLFNIRRMRRTHELMSQRALAEESDSMQRLAAVNMPENVLPYVLYLLSYHPSFPRNMSVDTEVEQRNLRKMANLVRAVVRVLVDSLGADENNIAFLLKQVNMIQHHYEDRHDKENIGLFFITRLATKVINEMVRTDENVQEYRGDISLPMELFELRSDDIRPGQRGPGIEEDIVRAVMVDGMHEAEAAMDRALHAGKKAHYASKVGSKRSSSTIRRPSKSGKRDVEGSDTESEDEDVKKRKSKASKPSKASKVSPKAPPRDEGERRQPRRQSVLPVNYKEPGESEKEAAKWDEIAGRVNSPPRQPKAINSNIAHSGESSSDEESNDDMDVAAVSPSSSPTVRLEEVSENILNTKAKAGSKGKKGTTKAQSVVNKKGVQTTLSSFIKSGTGSENIPVAEPKRSKLLNRRN